MWALGSRRRAAPRAVGALVGSVIVIGALAGCTAPAPAPSPTASTTIGATAAGTETTSPSPTSTTGATSTPSTSPVPASTQQGGGKGCSPNDVGVPAGADTATIADVDETDSDAVEFYTEQPSFEFGVHTKSGATVTLPDDLAGPNTHSGWMTRFPLAVVAVISDGRSASLHAFVNCRFVKTAGVDGHPYRFTLNGFGSFGTGVGCSTYVDGTRKLVGLNAVRLSDGRYRIDSTEVQVSADGRLATNGATIRGTTTYSADSAQVRAADTSTCGDVPIVHTSGR
ncbi:hypothetical protein [Amnibacterium kyonggiense]